MRGHDPDFIQERLEWRMRKHGGPYANTDLWVNASATMREQLPKHFVQPVIFSISLNEGATVVGVEQLCILSGSVSKCIDLDQVEGVTSNCLSEGKDKTEFDAISVTVDHQEVCLPTEAGAPCFAMWNTILTLIQMKKSS